MASKKDLLITGILRQNARIKLTELSRRTGIPVSTLFDRLHDLNSLGVTRLCAILDFRKLGFNTCATILLKAAKEKRTELKNFLMKSFCVNSLMRINNGYDFMAECIFCDMRELEEFCEKLEQDYGVRDKEIHFVIDDLKREMFLSDPLLVKG
ncbi:MAG: Lrp/AsnC family transcriptional regulator [Candidatus Woesearchaeota archaeon]